MELNRAIIFYNFLLGLTQQQRIDEINSILGDEVPSKTSVYRWYDEFNRGRSSLQDEFRANQLFRPKSVIVPETIDAVLQLILQDCHVTYREIETTLGISGWSIAQKINQSERQKCFYNWFKRMQKCIDLTGKYFEKQ